MPEEVMHGEMMKDFFMAMGVFDDMLYGDTNTYEIYPIEQVEAGNKFNYPPWGGICTIVEKDGEIWMARDVHATNGSRIWKTQNGDGARLQAD